MKDVTVLDDDGDDDEGESSMNCLSDSEQSKVALYRRLVPLHRGIMGQEFQLAFGQHFSRLILCC